MVIVNFITKSIQFLQGWIGIDCVILCFLSGLEALSKVDAKMLERLFPINEFRTEAISNPFPLKWINAQLNKEQKKAVQRICKGQNALPFIIFGPPGTGKSKTLCKTTYFFLLIQ